MSIDPSDDLQQASPRDQTMVFKNWWKSPINPEHIFDPQIPKAPHDLSQWSLREILHAISSAQKHTSEPLPRLWGVLEELKIRWEQAPDRNDPTYHHPQFSSVKSVIEEMLMSWICIAVTAPNMSHMDTLHDKIPHAIWEEMWRHPEGALDPLVNACRKKSSAGFRWLMQHDIPAWSRSHALSVALLTGFEEAVVALAPHHDVGRLGIPASFEEVTSTHRRMFECLAKNHPDFHLHFLDIFQEISEQNVVSKNDMRILDTLYAQTSPNENVDQFFAQTSHKSSTPNFTKRCIEQSLQGVDTSAKLLKKSKVF